MAASLNEHVILQLSCVVAVNLDGLTTSETTEHRLLSPTFSKNSSRLDKSVEGGLVTEENNHRQIWINWNIH